MQKELHWSDEERQIQEEDAIDFLKTMGLASIDNSHYQNLQLYRDTFKSMDIGNNGKISLSQLQQALNVMNIQYNTEELHSVAASFADEDISFSDFVGVSFFKRY